MYIKLEILTPEKSLFTGRIASLKVPGKKGSFMVYKNHAPLVSTLSHGTIKILKKDFNEENIEVSGGVIEVKQNNIVVLAEVD